MDNSTVYHVSILDTDIQAERTEQGLLPWTFETDLGQWFFATEEQACAEQRAYREETGFHPITGKRID